MNGANGLIKATFEGLKKRGEGALVSYITAGFPARHATLPMLKALAEGGSDIIELGIPFSDPTADGPAIQAACKKSLDGGFRLGDAFEAAVQFRREHSIPVIIFSYLNPILAFGVERFIDKARDAGASGLLIVDLPIEESSYIDGLCKKASLERIYLIAPTTGPERTGKIVEKAGGFLYAITMKGTTGRDDADAKAAAPMLSSIKKMTELPVVAGFGISTAEQVESLCSLCDGAVVGSELVRAASQGSESKVKERAAQLKLGTMKRTVGI